MTSKIADSIRRGLEEALAYAEGTADPSHYGIHILTNIDVKAIRAKLDMTQERMAWALAAYLAISMRTP